MSLKEIIVRAMIDTERNETAYHVGHRAERQCPRCGCYDFVRTHMVRTPDKWDLEENGGPHPNNTTFIVNYLGSNLSDPIPFNGDLSKIIAGVAEGYRSDRGW